MTRAIVFRPKARASSGHTMTLKKIKQNRVAKDSSRCAPKPRTHVKIKELPTFGDFCKHTETLCLDPCHYGRGEKDLGVDTYVPTINDVGVSQATMFQRWLWQALEGQPLSIWFEWLHYRRPTRLAYGHDHKSRQRSTTKPKQLVAPKVARSCKTDHPKKEAERRERQFILQNASDHQCGEFHFLMAEKTLPAFKASKGHCQRTNKASETKSTGKDEQLLASLYHHLHAAWLTQICQKLFGLSIVHSEANCVAAMTASVAAVLVVAGCNDDDHGEDGWDAVKF